MLANIGLNWLRAIDSDNGFAERVQNGVAVDDGVRTLAAQARVGYSWTHLALLFPQHPQFVQAAHKSFRSIPAADTDSDFRVYDQSFYLLFLSWYFRLTGEREAIRLLTGRYAEVERYFDMAGPGGFVSAVPGTRSHNPYMHLLEAVMAAFRATHNEFWLDQARRIRRLFEERLRDPGTGLIVEFRNPDWSPKPPSRVEIGHQLEWPTLLLELSEIEGVGPEASLIDPPFHFAMKYGFENDLAIDASKPDGTPIDRRKLLWSQTEVARHFAVRARILKETNAPALAAAHWNLIRKRFFHENGWTWHNSLAADGTPDNSASLTRLLYHVVSSAAGIT